MRLDGKVAIVTGGTGGIGRATAARLAQEGARVAVVSRSREKTEAVAAELLGIAIGIGCDVSSQEQVASAVEATLSRFGRLDIVVNNAGTMTFKPIQDLTAADWNAVLGVDLLGAAYFTRQAFLHMKGGGAIVNVSSVHARKTSPLVAPYAAAKAALLSLTRSAAIEGKEKGIRSNAVLPGAIDTPMLWDNPNLKSGAETIDREDVGRPEDVAAAIAFLASPDAAFVSGEAMLVDGGRLARL